MCESFLLRSMHVWGVFDEMIGDYWCVMKDLHVAILDFKFWTLLIFWKLDVENLHRVHSCLRFSYEFCYDLHTVSCGFSCMFFMITCGLWHCMSLGFWTKRLRFICARLDFQISLRFESGLQHKFKLPCIIFHVPSIFMPCSFMIFFNFSSTS